MQKVFGGKSLPTDKVLNYQQLKTYEVYSHTAAT